MGSKNWTATQAATAANRTSNQLLTVIAEKLASRDREAFAGELNWGHVGDAEHIKAKLLELVVGFSLEQDEDEEAAAARILGGLS